MKKCLLLFCTLLMVCFFYPLTVTAEEYEDLDDAAVFFKRDKEADVPIIMYHLVTEKNKYIGKYGITPKELEADLNFLKDNGYKTVVMEDLIAFVQRGKRLPKKPIVLTFDDGNTGDLNYVMPLLEKYKMKAVFSVIGEATDKFTKQHAANPKGKFPNLTWPQIKEMYDSGRCEIQSHGYNVHGRGGAGKRNGESTEAYHARLRADLQRLQNLCHEHLDFIPTTFTYPLGVISKEAQAVLEELGFVATLSCQEGMNRLKQGDPACLLRLKRSNRPGGKPIGILLDAIER
ncbi:MAG: polysaccharide deacetylase family protein [Defluviitaleaceae bacterium]|nr:polysaccharide deacetylase family protein [Defluviitaleaceae bacterium]